MAAIFFTLNYTGALDLPHITGVQMLFYSWGFCIYFKSSNLGLWEVCAGSYCVAAVDADYPGTQ